MINTQYSFIELKHWLDGLPDQQMGDPCAISNIGEPYIVFSVGALARPGDEAIVESIVAADMQRQIEAYLKDKSGRIYWRVPLEWEVAPYSVILRFDDNGIDKDFITDRRCVMDKSWLAVRGYCRLVKAKCRTMEESIPERKTS